MVKLYLSSFLAVLSSTCTLLPTASAAPSTKALVKFQAPWPNGPFVTSGRWMHDASGKTVTYAGVNWPGHGEVMVPEGLQYLSIEAIVSRIKSLGMNAIRLTYAIQMIDEIYANGGADIALDKAFAQGLGATNGSRILSRFLANNPQFTAKTTRLQVFDAVAAECAKQKIYIHLDNHISTAKWCCGSNDGNTWWGDTQFDTTKWLRGLAYMANRGKNWQALMSMSLRNEPREPPSGSPARATYNWRDWYGFVRRGADAINKANKDVLIFLSGLSYDTYVTPVVRGEPLRPGTARFSFGDFPGYANKLVLEIHNYETGQGSCRNLQNNLYNNGFQAHTSSAANQFPVLLTEYGFQMDATTWKGVYASCIASYMPAQKAGFFIWVLVGSYYTREGIQDRDEGWGLFNRDWSNWRSPSFIEGQLKPMVKATLA